MHRHRGVWRLCSWRDRWWMAARDTWVSRGVRDWGGPKMKVVMVVCA